MTAGVVAEYNPFHQGHACHLAKIHEKLGDNTPIVVVMSGAFVQRGEPAFIDPFLRTRMALKEGADLVLQLPTYYASATAEWFAIGGIQTLVKSGIVDTISFGMEDPSSLPLLQDLPVFSARRGKNSSFPGNRSLSVSIKACPGDRILFCQGKRKGHRITAGEISSKRAQHHPRTGIFKSDPLCAGLGSCSFAYSAGRHGISRYDTLGIS